MARVVRLQLSLHASAKWSQSFRVEDTEVLKSVVRKTRASFKSGPRSYESPFLQGPRAAKRGVYNECMLDRRRESEQPRVAAVKTGVVISAPRGYTPWMRQAEQRVAAMGDE